MVWGNLKSNIFSMWSKAAFNLMDHTKIRIILGFTDLKNAPCRCDNIYTAKTSI